MMMIIMTLLAASVAVGFCVWGGLIALQIGGGA